MGGSSPQDVSRLCDLANQFIRAAGAHLAGTISVHMDILTQSEPLLGDDPLNDYAMAEAGSTPPSEDPHASRLALRAPIDHLPRASQSSNQTCFSTMDESMQAPSLDHDISSPSTAVAAQNVRPHPNHVRPSQLNLWSSEEVFPTPSLPELPGGFGETWTDMYFDDTEASGPKLYHGQGETDFRGTG